MEREADDNCWDGELPRHAWSRNWHFKRSYPRHLLWLFGSEQGKTNPVLGSPMKRLGLSLTFFIAGLLTTWAALFAGSHLPEYMKFNLSLPASSSCHEIDLCSVPWWISALLIIYLLAPSLVFAVTGWFSARACISMSRRLVRLLALIAMTGLFYIASYVIGR